MPWETFKVGEKRKLTRIKDEVRSLHFIKEVPGTIVYIIKIENKNHHYKIPFYR